MTPPASQCRAALQRPIFPSQNAIWITDSLLASAFERYCRVSRTWNRKASNVPGPLESQRRLGRRRMGDASSWYCPPTPPSWAFPVPLDLSQWTWKPPSLARGADQSPLHHHEPTTSEVIAQLGQWLRGSVSEEPDRPPEILAPAAARPSPRIPIDMNAFRFAVADGGDNLVAHQTQDICSRLRQLLILGDILPEEVYFLSVEIWGSLERRLQGSALGHRLSFSFCRAILSGLANSKVFSPDLLETRFWNAILAQMATLPVNDTLCNLLANIIKIMPAVHRDHVAEGILSVLGNFISAWSTAQPAIKSVEIRRLLDITFLGELYDKQAKVAALPPILRQAKTISEMLHVLTPEGPNALLLAFHRLVGEAVVVADTRHSLRYAYLFILAHTPTINQALLFDAATALSSSSPKMKHLTGVEVSSLLLTQWASRGYLSGSEEVYRMYRRHRGKRDEAALASLFLALFSRGPPEKRKGLYRSAWKFLSTLNQKEDVLRSLKFDMETGQETSDRVRQKAKPDKKKEKSRSKWEAEKPKTLPVRMLEDLAFTSDDRHIAIRLHGLWKRHKKNQPDFFPGVFEKYAEEIIHDPSIPTKSIWRVLDINKHFDNRKVSYNAKLRPHQSAFGQRRAALVGRASKAFATAPHLSNRVALRHVYRSVAFLKAVNKDGQVPASVIQDLYRIVTSDLWREKPGRTKRLLLWIKLVEDQHGLRVAWSCRLALRRWRARLKRVWRSKGGGIMRRG
ncbi:hypothetical protein VTI74DRAFT_841 [Chaetomium olivicolor]